MSKTSLQINSLVKLTLLERKLFTMALFTKLEVLEMKPLKIESYKIIITLFFFFLLLSSCSFNSIFKLDKNPDSTLNNTFTISGYVIDRETKEPLIGAHIVLSSTKFEETTDIEGFFLINNIPPGKYSVTVSYVGFRSHTKYDIWFEGNCNYTLNAELVMD